MKPKKIISLDEARYRAFRMGERASGERLEPLGVATVLARRPQPGEDALPVIDLRSPWRRHMPSALVEVGPARSVHGRAAAAGRVAFIVEIEGDAAALADTGRRPIRRRAA